MHRVAGPGSAAAAWPRTLLAIVVQATVPSTASPIEPPTASWPQDQM